MKRVSAVLRCVLFVILTLGLAASAMGDTLPRTPRQSGRSFLRQLIGRVFGELSIPPGQPKP